MFLLICQAAGGLHRGFAGRGSAKVLQGFFAHDEKGECAAERVARIHLEEVTGDAFGPFDRPDMGVIRHLAGLVAIVTGDLADEVFAPLTVERDDGVAIFERVDEAPEDRGGILPSAGFLIGIDLGEPVAQFRHVGCLPLPEFMPADRDHTLGELFDQRTAFTGADHPCVCSHIYWGGVNPF